MFFDIHIHLRAEHVFYGKTKEGNKRRGGQESQSEGEIEGVKEERAAYRSPFALAAARQVQHRGQLPSLSRSKLPRPRVARQRPGATRCLLRQTCFGKRKRGRREQTGRGFSILSPHLPNSALIPSHCITAIDFQLASRGSLLLAT